MADDMSTREQRLRSLTERGEEHFQFLYKQRHEKYEATRVKLLEHIAHLDNIPVNKDKLHTYELDLTTSYKIFNQEANDLCSFLLRTSTAESDKLQQAISNQTDQAKLCMNMCIDSLNAIKKKVVDPDPVLPKQQPVDNLSLCMTKLSTGKSATSRKSHLSLQAEKRAKADAALAKLEFSQKEAELRKMQAFLTEQEQLQSAKSKREKAFIDAELKLISDRKETAAAIAEASALDTNTEQDLDTESLSNRSLRSLGVMNSMERVKQYVQSQCDSYVPTTNKQQSTSHNTPLRTMPSELPVTSAYSVTPSHVSPSFFDVSSSTVYDKPTLLSYSAPFPQKSPKPHLPVEDEQLNLSHDILYDQQPKRDILYDHQPKHDLSSLNPRADTFVPTENTETKVATEIGQFFLKKELLISRLTEFNEKPETYEAWKTSFKRLVVDLQMTPSDELEMLGKWLGPTSKKYAESARNSSMSDPARGVNLLWDRLDRCYGTPEEIEASLLRRLYSFSPITHNNPKRYYDLVDLLSEIESLQHNDRYKSQLAIFNTSSGVTPIAQKLLPRDIYEKWVTRTSNYKLDHNVTFPPFSVFVTFVKDMCRIRNDPSFTYQPPVISTTTSKAQPQSRSQPFSNAKLSVKMTSVSNADNKTLDRCPIHLTTHTLNECRAFRAKPIFVRRKFLSDNGICFGCCLSKDHNKSNCSLRTQCGECQSKEHPTALHINFKPKDNGGEQKNQANAKVIVNSKCTEICNNTFPGKSFAKIVLVRVYHKDAPKSAILTYAILDEQSNQSLAKSQLFSLLNIISSEIEYTVSSCSGLSSSSGRVAEGCIVESYDGTTKISLPPLIECDSIPENREEIPTPEVAASYLHLKDIEPFIPPLQNVRTLLLIGRDLGTAHHVLDQRLHSNNDNLPYAQKLRLGWVIIGEPCLGKVHKPNITVNKTHLWSRGRPTLFQPCENNLTIKEKDLGVNVFVKTADDNKVGMSVEDREFLHIMDNNFSKTKTGNWQAPLPFRSDRPTLPNNRDYTLRRARNLHNSLMKDEQKCEHMVTFVGKMLERGHAEVAPALKYGEESWYLPVFGVYHHQKPGQIRAVFDSSAQYHGVSLNSVLLCGPDLNNSLLNVLLRFRKEAIAAIGDIEQMFHSFVVTEEHSNFLRFFWYESNDPNKQLIEYRMKVHLFGNSPSPAVACYGLCKTADNSEQVYGSDVKSFIYDHFYVDDGLISLPSAPEIIDLLERTRTALKEEGNLRLHKFASNSSIVMQAFSSEDLAKDLKDLDFSSDSLPAQRSLGLTWNLQSDSFTFIVSNSEKPYTKRGILSVINSLYDPLGFAAPITITGKLFLRKVMSNHVSWDDPLPAELEPIWDKWKGSLSHLEKINIPRRYTDGDTSFNSSNKDLLIFSDASEDAIAAAAYIRTKTSTGNTITRFVIGKAKVAPTHGHSMPRLELCAAVLAVEIHDAIINALHVKFNNIWFYTDSRVVLGYINNRTRRFFMYVSNRVERIHQSSNPQQWHYISTKSNPADSATRSISAVDLEKTAWLRGPTFENAAIDSIDEFPLVEPESDKELKPQISVLTTEVSTRATSISDKFSKYSSWSSLLRMISVLSHIVCTFSDRNSKCHGWHVCSLVKLPQAIQAAKVTVLHIVQRDAFLDELESLELGKQVSRKSKLRDLDPYLDENKLIRVGGRISRSQLPYHEKFPIVLPKSHHVSLLLVRHYHQEVHHQGRHITQGALMTVGYWIIGEKRLISSCFHHCLTCKKLRGSRMTQKMSDLPEDRLTPAPPFSYVGIDVFGPWNIVYRRTKGALVNSKRWAVIFTCLGIRAIHIEVIEEMSSSCFINALRRFIAIRGPVIELLSDRGSNFIGSVDDLKANIINVEDATTSSYLNAQGITWKFNPPHSSHMGGVWERMIGVSRRILDSLLSGIHGDSLTHEMLVTFMHEVMAIVNARPLVPVTSNPENPLVLSPSVVLTQKTNADVVPFDNINQRDMYRAQWKRVHYLAERFWKRWSSEFLQSLQKLRKWQINVPNIKSGDVVLVKQTDLHRNNWPLGIITNGIVSQDGRVRKVEVRIIKDGAPKVYTRPISELVLLITE